MGCNSKTENPPNGSFMTPREIKAAYERGENITALLRKDRGTARNDEESIEVAYDLQAGRYIAALEKPGVLQYKRNYGTEIAKLIQSLGAKSVVEAGVGEATTLKFVLEAAGNLGLQAGGCDVSWSRVAYARAGVLGQRTQQRVAGGHAPVGGGHADERAPDVGIRQPQPAQESPVRGAIQPLDGDAGRENRDDFRFAGVHFREPILSCSPGGKS